MLPTSRNFAIVKNIKYRVISPILLNELVNAVGDKGYSIIIDESTDISVTKYMCICIKYFDTTKNRILTNFLGILEVERATADKLHQSIVDFLARIGIPLRNLTAIGTDGASNWCGCNHSVYTLLKRDVPNLQLMKCTCHSLHLCSVKASDELPGSVEYLAREVYSWFGSSPFRRIDYKKTFDAINFGDHARIFHQMIQLSRTRWLAFYDVVKRLLEQWTELLTHFRLFCNADKCYGVGMIRDMLEDDCNRLYLVFLKPILSEVQHLNISFQSDTVDVGRLYVEMSHVFLSLATRILKPAFLRVTYDKFLVGQVVEAMDNPLVFLPIPAIDFGGDFLKDIEGSRISADQKIRIKQRCFNLKKKLLTEMAQRLPGNLEIFKKFKLLSPSN